VFFGIQNGAAALGKFKDLLLGLDRELLRKRRFEILFEGWAIPRGAYSASLFGSAAFHDRAHVRAVVGRKDDLHSEDRIGRALTCIHRQSNACLTSRSKGAPPVR
jgi:hypothetical protein